MDTLYASVYTDTSNKVTLAHQKIQVSMQGSQSYTDSSNQSHSNYVFFHLNATTMVKAHTITSTQYITTLRSVNYINNHVLM